MHDDWVVAAVGAAVAALAVTAVPPAIIVIHNGPSGIDQMNPAMNPSIAAVDQMENKVIAPATGWLIISTDQKFAGALRPGSVGAGVGVVPGAREFIIDIFGLTSGPKVQKSLDSPTEN